MKKELFRETPFGGYKREDVLKYIDASDLAHRTALEEMNDRILELNAAAEAADMKLAALEKELKIKTEIAAEGEVLKTQLAEKDAQIEELLTRCKTLSDQSDEVVKTCDALTRQLEQTQIGFSCEKLKNGVCTAVKERAEEILTQAEEQAKGRISAAEEQASGILFNARMEAQAILTEAEGQTDALARKVSDEAHEIIAMTVNEARGILGNARTKSEEMIASAKSQSDDILLSSAQSIGKIKGNLSSMQMVVKNIENELKSAKSSLSESIAKKD